MKTSKYPITILALSLASLACSHKTVKVDPPTAPKAGEVSLDFAWIKDKGAKYDMQLGITNGTGKNILIYLSDFHCFKGSVEGTLKHTFFNTGHRTFKFHPNGHEAYNMVCNLNSKVAGNYRVSIDRVVENPSGDGITAGKTISQNIEIVQKDQ